MSSARKIGIVILSFGLVVTVAATTACRKKVEKAAAVETQKAANEFEGTVKTAVGKYLYLPTAQGFDIVLQGYDASSLIGKDIRVKGELLADKPSIFRADTVEVKTAGAYSTVYTRSQEVTFEDFVDVKARDAYAPLTITGTNKIDEWEGKGKAKVYGKLQETTVKEGGAEKPITYILLADEKGKDVGKIIVEKMTDYAKYYLKKLRLFDKFWFYLTVKDTVDKNVRFRTKELFHADVAFAGLF